MRLPGEGAYDYECPGNVDVFGMEVVAEIGEDARDDEGGDQLTEPENVESKRRVIGRLLGNFGSRHSGFGGQKRVMVSQEAST